MALDPDVLALLRGTALCFLATTMPDGSPQVTETWVDADEAGELVVVNTVAGYQKVRNMERDPRVALAIADPTDPRRYVQVRGQVVDMTTDGGAEGIEALSQRYLGMAYPWPGGRDQTRLVVSIRPDSASSPGGGSRFRR